MSEQTCEALPEPKFDMTITEVLEELHRQVSHQLTRPTVLNWISEGVNGQKLPAPAVRSAILRRFAATQRIS